MTAVGRSSSSDELRACVSQFMDRADEILAHPMAHASLDYALDLEVDPETLRLLRVGFDMKNLSKDGWAHLATCMRPIVFLKKEPISFEKFTGRIGYEHRSLADMLKTARQHFVAWEKHGYVGMDVLGPTAVEIPAGAPAPTPTITKMWLGEANTFPEGHDLSKTVWDYEYADVFFNGCFWHSDKDKREIYDSAGDALKKHILKCAEIRTLTGVRFVESLQRFIVDARADGHDL